jgi:hypothetical protein
LSLEGTIVHPGFRGGALWGGASFDPKLNRLFVNSDESVNIARLSKSAAGKDYPYDLTERIPPAVLSRLRAAWCFWRPRTTVSFEPSIRRAARSCGSTNSQRRASQTPALTN